MKSSHALCTSVVLALVTHPVLANDKVQVQQLRQEIEMLKQQLDLLTKKLERVEQAQQSPQQQVVSSTQYNEPSEGKAESTNTISPTGAFAFNYAWRDSGSLHGGDDSRLGRASYNKLILGAKGEIEQIDFDFDFDFAYAFYSYQDTIVRAIVGYDFNETWRGEMGVIETPFGILPYADNNWWWGTHYYAGLEWDYDLGAKLTYTQDPWNAQMAFIKTEEWGNSSKDERYTYDLLTDDSGRFGLQANEESNRLHGRVGYTFKHGDANKTEVGTSALIGQIYNTVTDDNGDHWAVAVHSDTYIDKWNIRFEGMRYEYHPENPIGVSEDTVLFGGYADKYLIPSEANIFVFNVARTIDVNWGKLKSITCYNDYSILTGGNSIEDSQIDTLGCSFGIGPIFTYVDFIFGKNAQYFDSDDARGFGGDGDRNWETYFNLNVGYYF
ncbi:hypothetical protein [Spartinivicinus ruber]|uniref:hypothetical protein n=1 Tax=Spartinivicinus ruber TaxID=2683272 RepID=UPI0013D24FDE|nr:hypothetical protein [Spartinivicinus ruber]